VLIVSEGEFRECITQSEPRQSAFLFISRAIYFGASVLGVSLTVVIYRQKDDGGPGDSPQAREPTSPLWFGSPVIPSLRFIFNRDRAGAVVSGR